MAAVSYHPLVFHPKYGQTDRMKAPNANRGLPFAVRQPNLDLKVSIIVCITLRAIPNYVLISRVLLPVHKKYQKKTIILLVKNMMLTIVNEFINKGQGSSPLQIRAQKKSHSLVQDRQIFFFFFILCTTKLQYLGRHFHYFRPFIKYCTLLHSVFCLLVCLFSLGTIILCPASIAKYQVTKRQF